jgi:tetratricopeptide (TPR) repeat protein
MNTPRRLLSPAELLQFAGLLRAQGKYAEAEAAYRRAAQLLPEDATAATGLGLLLGHRGAMPEALEHLRRACALAPENAETHNNLGRAARAAGLATEALTAFQAALALAPRQPEAHYNCAQALSALGRREDAMAAWRLAIALAPSLAPAHFQLGMALQDAGDLPAARDHLQQAALGHPPAHAPLARLLAALQEHEAANMAFAQALSLSPDDAVLHSDAGASQAAVGAHDQAIALFNRAIALQPSLAAAHNNLGSAFAAQERWPEAAAAFRTAVALEPDFPEARGNLCQALLELLEAEEALPHIDAALANDPLQAAFHNCRGRALVFLGDMQGAAAAHAEAVRLAPGEAQYYTGLALTHWLEADDPAFLKLCEFTEDSADQPHAGRVGLHFAMHRSLEHQGRHEEAFAHLAKGNALRRAFVEYDEVNALNFPKLLANVFTPELLRRAPPVPAGPDVPIFILGMPRSGSTLVEQILSSHRDVFGAGELKFLSDTAATLSPGGLRFPSNVPARSAAELAAAGDAYRARLRALAPHAPRITDKMPANFMQIGLIRLILPGARIIHTRRDPVDTCLSCFAQIFGPGLPYANDLGDIGRYYRAYERLMDHWRSVLPPGMMLDVDYEALIADFAPQVRRMLDFCGLDWDPACLDYHENKRPVLTASATQVRQKIYTRAAGRAKPYGALLAPLLEALAG